MCPITLGEKEYDLGGGILSEELYDKLRPLFPYVVRASLTGGGEPLIHPRCTDMVRELKDHGVEIGFSTNGILLTPALSRDLADAGLDYINLSVDAADPETYEAIRVGARFHKLRENLLALAEVRRETGGQPFLSVQMTLSRANMHGILDMVRFASEVQVGHLAIEPITPAFAGETYAEFYRENYVAAKEVVGQIRQARDVALSLGIPNFSSHYLSPKVKVERCSQPWITLGVRVDGSTIRCCGTPERMGDVKEDFWEAWNGPPFVEIRRYLAGGKYPKACGPCLREGRSSTFNEDLLSVGKAATTPG